MLGPADEEESRRVVVLEPDDEGCILDLPVELEDVEGDEMCDREAGGMILDRPVEFEAVEGDGGIL